MLIPHRSKLEIPLLLFIFTRLPISSTSYSSPPPPAVSPLPRPCALPFLPPNRPSVILTRLPLPRPSALPVSPPPPPAPPSVPQGMRGRVGADITRSQLPLCCSAIHLRTPGKGEGGREKRGDGCFGCYVDGRKRGGGGEGWLGWLGERVNRREGTLGG